jgi:hypothetical protein
MLLLILSAPPLLNKKDELSIVKVELFIVKAAVASIEPVPETVKFTFVNVVVDVCKFNAALLIVIVSLENVQLWQVKFLLIVMFPPEKEH